MRLVILCEDEKVYFFTHNGKEVKLPNIKRALEARPFSHYMLDTEVTLKTGKCEDRTKVSGMINSAMHGGVIDESKLQFNVFDYMSSTEFNLSHCSSLFWARRQQAERLVEGLGLSSIVMAKSLVCTSIEGIENVYAEAIANGYEGLILKHQNHKYTFKRSVAWTKMKEIKSVDLRCLAVEEGSGKYENAIGSLFCLGEVEGKQVAVHVGTGLTDEERCKSAREYERKLIEIKYNSVIQDKVTGAWSLFLPRFVCIRFDK